MSALLAIDFPPVSHVVEWPAIWGHGAFAVNKVVLLMWLAVILVLGLLFAGGKRALVPTGVQNIAEMAVEFVQDGIIMQTMGPDGLAYTPYLLTLFLFIFVCNIYEIIPVIQMPVSARIALPAFMAVVTWIIYLVVGIKNQGPIGYFKNIMFPPGVPVFIYPILSPVEFISTIFVRPFALAVRLFANLLAGHLILVSFAVLATALFKSTIIGAVAPGGLLIALTGFELLVSFLQAYIFTILAAVFIGGSMHPEH
jgi:F-type H+-transporting ATPase subunit a